MAAGDRLQFRDRAVYLAESDGLVIADLHLGRATTSAVDVPLPEDSSIRTRLGGLIDRFEPAELVIAGDVLDSFGTVPDGVDTALAGLRDQVGSAGVELTVVEGNHDPLLSELTDPVAEYRLGESTLVCHGHDHPGDSADRYVIGHDHPAIEIEGQRRPCFLYGPGAYDGSDVIVIPSFNDLIAGTKVNRIGGEHLQSPMLGSLETFRPIVVEESSGETYRFPPLGSMREFL